MFEMDNELIWYLIVLYGAAFIFAAIGIVRLKGEKSKKDWKSVKAIILKRFENNQPLGNGTGIYTCKFHLKYSYIVEGEKFVGEGYCAPQDYATNDTEMFNMIEGKFKVGNEIDVFHDPKRPSKSQVFITGSSFYMMFLAVAALCFILGSYMIISLLSNGSNC